MPRTVARTRLTCHRDTGLVVTAGSLPGLEHRFHIGEAAAPGPRTGVERDPGLDDQPTHQPGAGR